MASDLPPLAEFSHPNYSPTTCVLDQFKLAVAQLISSVYDSVSVQVAYEAIETCRPGKGSGDFLLAVPRFKLKGDPKALAEKLVNEVKPSPFVNSAQVLNGTSVTFILNKTTLARSVLFQINEKTHLVSKQPVPSVTASFGPLPPRHEFDTEPLSTVRHFDAGYGSNTSGEGKKVVVEFSSPNIAKTFHAGHLRTTIIGAVLANIYEANGWRVLRMNYIGDWGKQFGLLAVGFETYGSEEALTRDGIDHLYSVYTKISADQASEEKANKLEGKKLVIDDRAKEYFAKMENRDSACLAFWERVHQLSLKKYREMYTRLGIQFDAYASESQVSHAKLVDLMEKLGTAGVTEVEENGAVRVDLEPYQLGKPILRKEDGAFIYLTRDIIEATERWQNWKFNKMIYIVGSEQEEHFKQLFKTLEILGHDWVDRLRHISYGLVLGMSTRKGTSVFLHHVLDESGKVMLEQLKKSEDKYNAVEDPETTCDILGISAVKIQDLSAKRGSSYSFNWNRMTSFEGATGPYLQYAHVRLSSVERKNAPSLALPDPSLRPQAIDTSLLTEEKARDLILLLATYPEVIRLALKTLEPSVVVSYCFRLAQAVSSAWSTLIVKGAEREVGLARLWLYVSARDVLASAMKLLTLQPLNRM